MKRTCCIALFLLVWTGCHRSNVIEVDLTTPPPRFVIDHHGWPAPFRWPRVTDFAIASDEDGAVWELRSEKMEGVPARMLAIIYGELPPGFLQVTPAKGARARPLVPGRTYYVGAVGPSSVYRIVFALPVGYWEPMPSHPTSMPNGFAPWPAAADPAPAGATSAPSE